MLVPDTFEGFDSRVLEVSLVASLSKKNTVQQIIQVSVCTVHSNPCASPAHGAGRGKGSGGGGNERSSEERNDLEKWLKTDQSLGLCLFSDQTRLIESVALEDVDESTFVLKMWKYICFHSSFKY